MTNQSPPESQNPIPERRRRPATGVTFDEMIAIIVAFSAIGAILFWAMGGRNNKFANNFGLGGSSSLLSGSGTTDTGIGFGNILSGNNVEGNLERQLELENRRLAAQLREQDEVVAYVPPNKSVTLPERAEERAFSLDSGAKLVPLTGVAALPGLSESNRTNRVNRVNRPRVENNELNNAPAVVTPETEPEAVPETREPEAVPEANVPADTETAQTEPAPITGDTTEMPEDVVPDYWAFPFVKQMRDKALVPEIAKNQEFDPDTLITRASMATLISQAFEDREATESIKKFNDVSNQNAIAQDIDRAVRTGFMQGYSDNEFKPLENIPRYQVLVTLATGLGLEPSQDADQILQQFGDSSNIPDWARQQVAAATEAGLVVNPPDVQQGFLAPEKSATRAEVAAMIHQALVETGKVEPLESEYIVKP